MKQQKCGIVYASETTLNYVSYTRILCLTLSQQNKSFPCTGSTQLIHLRCRDGYPQGSSMKNKTFKKVSNATLASIASIALLLGCAAQQADPVPAAKAPAQQDEVYAESQTILPIRLSSTTSLPPANFSRSLSDFSNRDETPLQPKHFAAHCNRVPE